MFAKILLRSTKACVEFIGFGECSPIRFSVIGPASETDFFDELLEEEFGSLKIDPDDLFNFLSSDKFVQSKFEVPEWIQQFNMNIPENHNDSFHRHNLGQKLLISGIVNSQELDQLLDEYQSFAKTQRFGEFLKLKLGIPFPILDFFLNPSSLPADEFNDLKLGTKLFKMGILSEQALTEALDFQKNNPSLRLGDILVKMKAINPNIADFFSQIKVDSSGQIIFKSK